MKKISVKRILLSVFMAVFMLATIAGVVISSPLLAKADANAWKTGVFVMNDGVSLRLSESNGLRFIVKMDEAVADFVKETEEAELGFVIAPKQLMVAANGDYLNMPKKVGGAADKNKIYEEDGFYYANGCITNMKSTNITYDFVAVAYIKYESEIRYTEYNDLARNNLYDTVNMAVLNGYAKEVFQLETYTGSDDPNDDNTGWYGSETYPIVLETTAEYNALKDIVDKEGIDLSGYQAIVESEVITGDFSNVGYQPTMISAALYKVQKSIAELPNSVTMPDAIGMIARIRETEKLYNALSETDKAQIENYAKVEGLIASVQGYDRVYSHGANDGTVIPSYVPNATSAIGGTAATATDAVYGNYLIAKPNAGGRVAIQFNNFPSVAMYEKIYFYIRQSSTKDYSVYASDDTENEGWGTNWKNNNGSLGRGENLARAKQWSLIEFDVSSGIITDDWAFGLWLGGENTETDITLEISDIYAIRKGETATGLTFGVMTETDTSNQYGKVFNLSPAVWATKDTDLGAFNAGALSGALGAEHNAFYFWIYNPNATDATFYFNENGTWTRRDIATLKAQAWTKVVISSEFIEVNRNILQYVCVTQGAQTKGWQMTSITSFDSTLTAPYLDHADVKAVIALIDGLPANVTLENTAIVEAVRAAYEALTEAQKGQIVNLSKLTAAETHIADLTAANKVVALIDDINPRAVDKAKVEAARKAYNDLTDTQKGYVTNLAKLESYEATIDVENKLQAQINNVNSLIANLPDSVVMPDHLVFVTRIEKARDAYEALSDAGKNKVENYAKLRTLVSAIKGYETVHIQTLDSVNVIPSHVPNYTSTIGGTASMGYDGYYGDYLKVTPDSGGKVAIQFKAFPSVSQYIKLYFNIRVVGTSCDIYLSDGISNDGWGEGWNNTWSVSGFWANDSSWIQKEIDLGGTYMSGNTTKYIKDIFASNWALGLRTNTAGVSFEITNIVGVRPDLGEKTELTFGKFTDSGTTNVYGTVYNFEQGWTSNTDMGAFNAGALNGYLNEGHDAMRFYIYNPNETAVDFRFLGEYNNYTASGEYLTSLSAKAWTEVIISPKIIKENMDMTLVTIKNEETDDVVTIAKGLWYVSVSSGADKAGWKISPMYSFSSTDAVGKIQDRINALDTETPDEYQVQLAREAYEALSEVEKALIDIEKLTLCEEKLYDGGMDFPPFIVGGKTQYKIYMEDYLANNAMQGVVDFVNEHLEAATGVALATVAGKPQNSSKYHYALVFGYWGEYSDLGGLKQVGNITSRAGYAIERIGRTVFILANSADGYRMGAIAFLREVIGYDMIAEDCVIYNGGNDIYLDELDMEEAPSFDYRQKQTYMTEEEMYGMGIQSNTEIWVHSNKGWDMHNSLHYLPAATYRSAHPSWYFDAKNKEGVEICPTAGGNSAEFNTMVETIAANMLVQINEQPEKENICFSAIDTVDNDDCKCSRCKLYDTLYGEGGYAAAWIDLMNAVNAKIRPQLPEGKVLNIAFLAYRDTEKAPASIDGSGNVTLMKRYQINDNGTYTQTSEYLKCDEGVTVWLAPINAKFAENFNHADNATHLATVKKWLALSDSVYLWMYGTNFKYYMYPYNTWKASAENYKILKELGVKAVWSQSNETEATAFTDLKAYIDSKFMHNVYADYDEVLNTYFTNYFGAGATKMRALFNKIVAKCEEIEEKYDGLGRGIYDELENTSGLLWIGSKTYWAKDWLEECVTLCDEAKAAVDADTTLTDAQKTAFKNRITKESLFPRYVLCTSFASSYSNSNKKTMRQQFKADATALGVTLYREANGTLSALYSNWGI